MRYTGFSPKVRAVITERAKGFCEVCGFDAIDHIHHRRARSMGGTRRPETNQAANGLAVSAECHTMLESRRALATENGWLVSQTANPADVPVLYGGGAWVYLTDDGRIIPAGKDIA